MTKRTKKQLRRSLKKYSTLANVLASVSTVGFGVLYFYVDYLTLIPLSVVIGVLATAGIAGKVIQEEIEDEENV